MQELLETKYNCYLWNKKAVLAIVKGAAAMSDHNYATKFNATKIKLVPIYTDLIPLIMTIRTVRNEI